MKKTQFSYFVEYVRGGDPDTELIRDAAFVADDDSAAKHRAKENLIQAGVTIGTLFKFREGGSGDATEIARVEA